MSGIAPTVQSSGSGALGEGVSVGLVAAVWIGAVLLQISVVSELRVASAIPDLVAVATVVVAARHGALVGGVAGFGAGLLVELATPSGTLGVLALAGLLGGTWAGLLAERHPKPSLPALLFQTVAVAVGTQLLLASIWLLLGHSLRPSAFAGSVVIPCAGLTALISLPVLALVRRRIWPPEVPAALPLVDVTP